MVAMANGVELLSDGSYKLKWLIGTAHIEPITYWLEEKIIKRKFWFSKKEYYIVCEFCKLGPMNLKDANRHLNIS